MQKEIRVFALVLLAFIAYTLLMRHYFSAIYYYLIESIPYEIVAYGLAYFIVGLPAFVAVFIMHKKHFFASLGFNQSILKGIVIAFFFTLPMAIGYALFYTFNHGISLGTIVQGAVYAAFFEELYFRAFFFGMLFRYTRFGFIPSLLLGAIVFGLLHLNQSNDPATMFGIFTVTFFGSAWFSWVYAEWKFNIWLPVSLHMLMNLYWMLFNVGDSALGSVLPNVFRVLTIALTIVFTIYYKRRMKLGLTVNGNNIWLKPREG